MVFFGYSVGGYFTAQIDFGITDRTGNLTRHDSFEAPYCSMVHDFMVTRNHVLFPILPLTGDLERVVNGGPAFAWDPSRGAQIGILHRQAAIETLRWFEVDPCYVFHPLNAFEDGDLIHADVMKYPVAPLFPNPDGSGNDPALMRACLTRWTFDLAGGGVTETALDDLSGEFPRFDERFAGLPYHHGWFAFSDETNPVGFYTGLAGIDLESGRRKTYRLPAGDAIGEPVFVPRHTEAAEGDGWLLAVAYRGHERRSDFLVFEAADLDKGPIAAVQLSSRVPFGFHGNWRSDT